MRAATRLAFAAAVCALSPVDAADNGDAAEGAPTAVVGYSLAKIDPLLRVAVVRDADGSVQALREGRFDRARRLRVARIYADRIEVEVPRPTVR